MSLSDRTVFLHIGPPKTGTTYLQDILWRNRARLATQGMHFPGDSPVDHFHAALDLRGIRFGGDDNPDVPGAWPRLMTRLTDTDSESVVISHEVLCGAKGDEIARVGHDLAEAETHVVCGARDLARQLPAVWQESLKNRRTQPFDQFLDAALIRHGRRELSRRFWRGQDIVAALRRWSVITDPSRVHVVTVPRGGTSADELWRRFAHTLGLTPDEFNLDVARSNTSLNAEDAEFLRRLNEVLPADLPWPAYERLVKRRFRLLANEHAGTGTPIRVGQKYAESVIQYAVAMQEALAASGYDIVGDLADLSPSESSFGPDLGSLKSGKPDSGAIVSDAEIDSLAQTIIRKASRRHGKPMAQARTLMAQLKTRTQRSR